MMEKLLTLGIDPFAMLVYMANTGLVLIILTKLLYKPVLRILDQRRDMVNKSMTEAENLREAFEKQVAEVEKQKKQTEMELKEEISKLHKFTEEKRIQLVAEMEAAKSAMIHKAQEEIETRKAGMMKEIEHDVKMLMGKVILDIVENKVPEKVIEESISSSWKNFSK